MKKRELSIFAFFLMSIFLISSISAAVGALSEARIQSNFFGFDKAWIVDFVSDDFTTDRITAFFTPNDFESISGDKTKQSLTISAITKPSSCQWSLKEDFSTKPDVFIYIPISFTDWVWNEAELEAKADIECANFRVGTTRVKTRFFTPLTHKIWCVKTSIKLGTVGEFINPFILAETDWTVQVSGKTAQTATISNSEIGEGRSSPVGNRVFVQWQGLAGTGESCPLTQNNVPIHSNSFSNGWRVVDEGNYDTYKNYIETELDDDIFDWAIGVLEETQLKNTALIRANNAIISSNAFGSFSVLSSSVSSGKISVDLGRLIVFPQFRLIIDADYLELDIPTGVPAIVSFDKFIKFTEGSAGSFSVTIKNTGTSRGGFTTRIISCTNGFSSNTPPQGSVLDPDETDTLTFEIIGSTTSTQAVLGGSCTVEVKESITGKTDTKIFNTELTQIRECPPPQFACGVEGAFHVVKECNSEGTGLNIIETCQADEICKEIVGGAECRKKGTNGNGNGEECPDIILLKKTKLTPEIAIPNVICKIRIFFQKVRFVASIVLGFLGGLLAVTYVLKLLNKKTLKKTWWILLITFILVGGAIGLLAFIFFWWVVLLLIVLGIVRAFIPGI